MLSRTPLNSFCIFSFLWAAAALFHLIASLSWIQATKAWPPNASGIIETALAVAAIFVLFRPSSVIGFFVLGSLQIADVLHDLPSVPNHWLLPCLVNFTFFFSLLQIVRQKQDFQTTEGYGIGNLGERIYWDATRSIRIMVVFFYFFAFFSKLNSDFFDVQKSCAVQFYGQVVQYFPFFPQAWWVGHGIIYGTFVVEGALCCLLTFSRTRLTAVLLGALFHFALAFDMIKHFFDFSSCMFALLFVFVPPDFSQRMIQLSEKVPFSLLKNLHLGRNTGYYFRLFLVIGFLIVITAGYRFNDPSAFLVYFKGRELLWLFYATTLLVIFIRAVFFPLKASDKRVLPTSPIQLHHLIMPALVILNGLGPYLGLKTRSAWQMYGNLRMEATESNHFLIPKSLDVAGFLSDTITIVSTSDPKLYQDVVSKGLSMTVFEFRSYIDTHPQVIGTYLHHGVLKDMQEGKEWKGSSSFLEAVARKLFWFQPVGEKAGELCLW